MKTINILVNIMFAVGVALACFALGAVCVIVGSTIAKYL